MSTANSKSKLALFTDMNAPYRLPICSLLVTQEFELLIFARGGKPTELVAPENIFSPYGLNDFARSLAPRFLTDYRTRAGRIKTTNQPGT